MDSRFWPAAGTLDGKHSLLSMTVVTSQAGGNLIPKCDGAASTVGAARRAENAPAWTWSGSRRTMKRGQICRNRINPTGDLMVTKAVASAAAFLLVTMLASQAAAAADADVQRQVMDRAQIDSLMWHYVRALDTLNADAYVATYTADGQFGSGASAVKGRDALKKMIVGLRQRAADAAAKTGKKGPSMYHVLTNSYVEFEDRDHAHMEAYWMTLFAQNGATVPVRVAAAGREVDELVRVNGHWLIKSRDVAPPDAAD